MIAAVRWAALLVVLAACGDQRTWGRYHEHSALIEPPTPGQRDAIGAGEHFVVEIIHTETPAGCGSERMRQTDITIELPARPPDGASVDLARARVTYAWGGMRPAYRSNACHGSLVLHSHASTIAASLAVSCDSPVLGDGERQFAETVDLAAQL